MKTEITNNQRAIVKFEELCEWRKRFHTSGFYRMSACDRHSNFIQNDLYKMGYIVWISDDPNNDGYAYGLSKKEDVSNINGTNGTKYFLVTDRSLGYDLSNDAKMQTQ